jgi:hypothetical protein
MAHRKYDISQLNKLYQQGESVDREIFAEMRSNILLVAGDHFNKRAHRYFSQIRDNRDLTDYQKLRIFKNHIHKIQKRYSNTVYEYADGVSISPQLQHERQDQKSAELNLKVYQDARYRYNWTELFRKFADDFTGPGEVGCMMRWNPDLGELIGYQPTVDEFGDPFYAEDGEYIPDMAKPVYTGDFEFERLFAFNLLRDAGAKAMDESPYLIYRKMSDTFKLREMYKSDPKKLQFITEDKGTEFIIFDATKGGYDRSYNQTLVREFYFKPSVEHPNGYFYITTRAGILEEGELPFGIWPFVWAGFDEHPTSARARSIVKQARPFQAEINRASSSMAMHQVTIGDDKILYQAGTKLAPGALLPGVRGLTYQGTPPQILPGRDGGQYQTYIDATIAEMYKMLDVFEQEMEKDPKGGQQDPIGVLFKSAKQRQKLSRYSQKFGRFIIEFVELFLRLAKRYYPDEMLISAIGRGEIGNIPEWRATTPLQYRIHIEEQDNTVETKFGRHLTNVQILQYAGKQLAKEDLGMIIRNLPFANTEEMSGDLTVDYDNVKNDMLALERGEFVPAEQEDNHAYYDKKLTKRMKEPDFRYLDPQVQQLYQAKRAQHRQLEAEKQQKLIDLKNEYVPVDGPLIACDMYVPNPDPKKAPKRARIPQRALDWLLKTMNAQGASLERVEKMNLGQISDAQRMLNPAGMPGGQGQSLQPNPGLGRQAPDLAAAGGAGGAMYPVTSQRGQLSLPN